MPISETGFAPMAVMIMAPGAFIVVAVILGMMNRLLKTPPPVHADALANREISLFLAAKPEALKAAGKQEASGAGEEA